LYRHGCPEPSHGDCLIDPATYQANDDSAVAKLAHDEAALATANATAAR
jgi:hypothetical protein